MRRVVLYKAGATGMPMSHSSPMRACDTAGKHAVTAEVYSTYDPPKSDQDRQ
jgi:hypothetical protein